LVVNEDRWDNTAQNGLSIFLMIKEFIYVKKIPNPKTLRYTGTVYLAKH